MIIYNHKTFNKKMIRFFGIKNLNSTEFIEM